MPQPPNMQQMMRQVQKMQQEMAAAQEQLKHEEVEASAGGGMVKVKVSGDLVVKSVVIAPEAIDPDDPELLQDMVLAAVNDLERGNRWHALARLSLRDDLYSSLRAITLDVLRQSDPGSSADEKIDNWERANASRLSRARSALEEIQGSGRLDLATLSVAARQMRSMVR